MPSLNDIRSAFLGFFESNGHRVVDSSPLVPRNDPTLMFVNSGMVQFKNLFTGVEKRDYVRATTSQKCVRAGGKHNDLDNVGYTARHHTFFEMLGNFSFGDYFKEDAIHYAWELLTGDFGINPDKLLATVYHTDDEAALLWKKIAGLSDDRIIRIPTNDNFWMMGPTGPCGPCTEIFYDHGDHIWGGPPGSADQDGDRFIEIWNLVFMQYEQFEDGTRRDLANQSIDTGMGLERVGALLQGKHDTYDTDLMRSLIEASAHGTSSDPDGPGKVHHRVIADHLRSTSFLIADGVMPSNEGRGYVLRRIMRRAMRHAHLLGARDPLMHRLVPALVRQMGAAYPDLVRGQALIAETLRLEETRFKQTLERGLKLLDDELEGLDEGASLPGAAAFKLYDTFGFPLDLTQDALREKGRAVDTEGFETAMAAQKAKARASWVGSGETRDATIWFDLAEAHGATEFLGYDTETAEAQILALKDADGHSLAAVGEKDADEVMTALRHRAGDRVRIVVNQTPFYAESGGQVGDTGEISTATGTARITDTRKSADIVIHFAKLIKGQIASGQPATLKVNDQRRRAIRANHSATHLLHEALRRALGDHVAQRGSLNAEDRLRFDFSHSKGLSDAEMASVEAEVNDFVRQNSKVETRIMNPDEARDIGAQALFGEKYGDEVRVVLMGHLPKSGTGFDADTYSMELCGGTHVARTGDIGAVVLLGDSASSAGVRRIEALTGQAALAYLRAQGRLLTELAAMLKTQTSGVAERVRALLGERKALAQRVEVLEAKLALRGIETKPLERDATIRYAAAVLRGTAASALRPMVDELRQKVGTGFVILGSENEGKCSFVVGLTADLTNRLSAVEIVNVMAKELGGKGGGGKPDFAQAGAPSLENFDNAVKKAKTVIDQSLFGG